jgi:hypothetical protein
MVYLRFYDAISKLEAAFATPVRAQASRYRNRPLPLGVRLQINGPCRMLLWISAA